MNNEKKFLLIKECVGTEPYVNARCEMDIKDIIEYAVISRDEKEECDIVKILQQSDDENYLLQCKKEYEESDFYMGY